MVFANISRFGRRSAQARIAITCALRAVCVARYWSITPRGLEGVVPATDGGGLYITRVFGAFRRRRARIHAHRFRYTCASFQLKDWFLVFGVLSGLHYVQVRDDGDGHPGHTIRTQAHVHLVVGIDRIGGTLEDSPLIIRPMWPAVSADTASMALPTLSNLCGDESLLTS